MAAVMNDHEFDDLLDKARKAETAEKVAEVLAIVDRHEGIVHREYPATGSRLLHWASGGGHVNLMRGLIDRGAEVSAKASDGRDALMWAALDGHIPAATLLLDRGADVNARYNNGRNALMIAATNDKLECAVFLLTRGFDLDAKDNNGKTALDLFGTGVGINLTIEVKEQRREVLRAAFTKAKLDRAQQENATLRKEVAIFRRPAPAIPPAIPRDDKNITTYESQSNYLLEYECVSSIHTQVYLNARRASFCILQKPASHTRSSRGNQQS